MRYSIPICSLLLAFSVMIATPAWAQQPSPRPGMMDDMPMMQMPMMGAMHAQMMQNPLHRSSMMAFMLPTLADTLGLTDEQVSRVSELKGTMMREHQNKMKQMQDRREQMMDLFEGDECPDPAEVRRHLMASAEQQAEQKAALYETAQQMQQVLTDDQRQMLQGMTHQQKMRQMMANMTMMDMMQMMRTMRGGMMQPGMMQMMQDGMMKDGMMKDDGVKDDMPMHRQNRDQ